MKRKAIEMLLSSKAKEQTLFVLDNLKIEEPKTKLMAEVIKNLKPIFQKGEISENRTKESILIVLANKDNNIIRASRNIAGVETVLAKDLNALQLLSFKYLVTTEEAIKVIKEKLTKKNGNP